MKRYLCLILLLLCAVYSSNAQEPAKTPQTSGGGASANEPSFRVIRSVAGTKLFTQGGRSGVEDPRSIFYASADKEIIVYFTWEGPIGPHHFEGLWKRPSGNIAMTSEFDYSPQQPTFGAYFRMLLGDSPATGNWTLEARIDGETAGSHSFQVSADSRPDSVVSASARRVMPPAKIYNQAAAASVVIENINLRGARRSVGSGFFIAPHHLLTAFQVIDNAAKVRVVDAQGNRIEVTEVVAVNRRQDWIVLNVPLENVPSVVRAPKDSWAVGDRAYFLDVPAEGNRVLVETSLIGKQTLEGAGERMNIASTVNRMTMGSPVLNEYGEAIGLIGGGLIPGAAFVEDAVFGARMSSLDVSRGTWAVPLELVNQTSGLPITIEGLAKDGQFIPALVTTQSVLQGVLARAVNKKTNPPLPVEEKKEISRSSPQCVVFITWLPTEKRKGQPSLRLYDLDNHLISVSPNKKKITVRPNEISYSLWDLNLANLPKGIYRIDVLLDDDFVWRTFFRMVD